VAHFNMRNGNQGNNVLTGTPTSSGRRLERAKAQTG
jgi:hypothetical protein